MVLLRSLFRGLIMAMLAAALTIPAAAQGLFDAADPPASSLADLLRLVPLNGLPPGSLIAFSDYQAAALARPAAGTYASAADLIAAFASDDPAVSTPAQLYAFNLPGSALPALSQNLRLLADMPAVLGFDVMQIDAALLFGTPPDDAYILRGRFDQAAVIAAHEERGYTRHAEAQGAVVLCPPAGCASGADTDFRAVNQTNIFGGDLGMNWPIGVTADGYLWASRSFDQVDLIYNVYCACGLPLDDPALPALVSTIDGLGAHVRQAVIFNPLDYLVQPLDPAVLLNDAAPPDLSAIAPLPPYTALAVADVVQDDGRETGALVLVFADEANAVKAGDVLTERLTQLESVSIPRPLFEVLVTDRDAELNTVIAPTDAGTGLALTFTQPPPDDDPAAPDGITTVISGDPFTVLLRLFYLADTTLIALDPGGAE